MTLEEQLLKKAESAGTIFVESERRATLARAEYHTAIRRLHLAGGSLREIAQALSLSHQRVQQIVDAAGGSWWQRVWRTRNVKRDAVCTYCQHPPSEVQKLIAGPNVYICDGCISAAEKTLGKRLRSGEFTLSRGRKKECCAFCGHKPTLLAAAAKASVCAECLQLCREILADRPTTPRRG